MIICHCNAITAERIEAATIDALKEMPAQLVSPEHVYARCKVEPDCGSCRELIRLIIQEIARRAR